MKDNARAERLLRKLDWWEGSAGIWWHNNRLKKTIDSPTYYSTTNDFLASIAKAYEKPRRVVRQWWKETK